MTVDATSTRRNSYHRYNRFLVLIALLILLSSSQETAAAAADADAVAEASPSCKVTINDKDLTDELFVVDDSYNGNDDNNNDEEERYYVDCMGKSKCRDAIITNCPRIKCYDNEACNNAAIINFTESVLCEGLHSCHRTNITLASSDDAVAKAKTTTTTTKVLCIGSTACDVAQISGEIDVIDFVGVKAGRKVHVEDAKLVKCRDGKDKNKACESLATFQNVGCLYCGQNGCADHINTCRYKLAASSEKEEENENEDDDSSNSMIQFEKCQPKKVLGGPNCPAGLENELRMELMGKEEIEFVDSSSNNNEEEEGDGGRKKKRGIRGLRQRLD